jgi:hypothetical protein
MQMNLPFRVISTKRNRAFLLCLLVAVLSSGCAGRQVITGTQDRAPVSPKFGPSAYMESGTLVAIGVDTFAASKSKEGTIFPLGLALANNGKTPLTFNKESFILETGAGDKYPLVSHHEYLNDYTRSRADQRLAATFIEALNLKFRQYRQIEWPLFPYAGSGSTRTDTLELNRMFWTHLNLYFPTPPEGLQGEEFALLIRSADLEDTLIVRFKIK